MSKNNPNLPDIGGALFENSNPNGPAMNGFIEIDGQKFWFSCWPATAQKTGDPYFRLSSDDRKNQQNGVRPLNQGQRQAPQRHPARSPAGAMQMFAPRKNPNITTGPQGQAPRSQGQPTNNDLDDDICF